MKKQLVVVFDHSVNLAPYLDDIKTIIERIARKFYAKEASTSSASPTMQYNLNLIVTAVKDVGALFYRATRLDSFLYFLSKLNFDNATHLGNSGVNEGLSAALKKFPSLHTQRQSHLRQCVLVTASHVCPDYENIFRIFMKSYVSLSVICPCDTIMSRAVYDTANRVQGSFIMALKQPSIVVFICGQFPEAREIIEQFEAENNNGNKSEQDVLVSLANGFSAEELAFLQSIFPETTNDLQKVVDSMPVIADNEISDIVNDFSLPSEPTFPETTNELQNVVDNMPIIAENEISHICNDLSLPLEPTFTETTQELQIVQENMPIIADNEISNVNDLSLLLEPISHNVEKCPWSNAAISDSDVVDEFLLPSEPISHNDQTWALLNELISAENDVASLLSMLEPIFNVDNGMSLSVQQGGLDEHLQDDQNVARGSILMHPEEMEEFNTLISHDLWNFEVANPNFPQRSFNINFNEQQVMANLLISQEINSFGNSKEVHTHEGTATSSANHPFQMTVSKPNNTFHLSTSWLEKNNPEQMLKASKSKVVSHSTHVGSSTNVSSNHNTYTNLPLEVPSGYIQAWEGSITSRTSGITISVSKLVAYRKPEVSEKIFEKWPKMMQSSYLVPLTDTSISPNTVSKQYLVFGVSDSWPSWVSMKSKNLCAYVDLPGQTLILWVSADKTHLMGTLCEEIIPIPIDYTSKPHC